MTNDAKLGMLAGVLGVIVAGVLFAHAPPGQPSPGAPEPPAQKNTPPPAVAVVAPPERKNEGDAPASTPVARTRKEVEGRSTSRQPEADEEP